MNVNGALYNIIINLTFTNMFAVVAVIMIAYYHFFKDTY